jgi:ABC-type transport system involved in multi-copper enzyme maturation permease subunit
MMFASALELEREPLQLGVPVFMTWVQNVGFLAALAILIWSVAALIQRPPLGRRRLAGPSLIVFLVAVTDLVLYVFFGLLLNFQGSLPTGYTPLQNLVLTTAGALALVTVAVPPLMNLVGRVRWQRVAALARLSIKEAVRGRVLYVFGLMALLFLFAGYFVSYAPEDQIRNYVTVINWALSFIFVLMAALLGAFSIPRDVTRQTIHTIVTKPVERYEIVLGRFFGYGALLTVSLFILTSVSLVYLFRGITPQARQESYKARVTQMADALGFFGTGKPDKGEGVGREWDYRSYIRGRRPEAAGQPKQYAIWSFDALPAALAERQNPVPFEFTFDIYRTTKAEKGKEGVLCDLVFAPGHLTVPEVEKLARAADKERRQLLEKALSGDRSEEDIAARRRQVEDELIAKYGVYEASGVPVVDYHTRTLEVPASLFAKLKQSRPKAAVLPTAKGEAAPPEMKVLLSVGEDRSSSLQLIGVAKRDLYLLTAELPFWQNFFKGALGLWLRVLLVLGVALACSTYLSGIISLICTLVLYCGGLVSDFVADLASGRAPGGGPTEAATRILYGLPVGAQLDPSPGRALGQGIDQAYSLLLRYVLMILPDVGRFDLTAYVANGFDIPWAQVLLVDNFVPLVLYLVPWAILAYYLISYREIANPS